MKKLFLLLFLCVNIFVPNFSNAVQIAVVVNNVPLTTTAIERRVLLLRLRNVKGDLQNIARQELIDEILQKQEAQRLNINISQNEIDISYGKFASDNNLAVYELDNALQEQGVSVRSFKEYIKAGLSWQRVVGLRFRAQTQADSNKQLSYLFGGDDERVETTQYSMKHIIFVIPKEKLETQINARLTQANNFRRQFRSCDSIIDLAKKFKNVSVLEKGRTIAANIPERWRKEIKTLKQGELTRALRTERGVELYAVCKTEVLLSSNNENENSLFGKFSNPSELNKELESLGKQYNDELRANATIREN